MKALSFFLTIGLAALWSAKVTFCQDFTKVAPNSTKVLLENDKVRVVEFWSKKGEKFGMHSHPNYVVYFLSDGKVKTTLPDGKNTETEAKAGTASWSEAVTHANENIGSSDVHGIVIELKTSEMKK